MTISGLEFRVSECVSEIRNPNSEIQLPYLFQHHLPLSDDVAFFDKSNGHKSIGWRSDVIKRPIFIVVGQHLADTLGAVNGRDGAVLPIEQFHTVMELLFLAIDRHLDFNILFTGQGRDGNCDVSHVDLRF